MVFIKATPFRGDYNHDESDHPNAGTDNVVVTTVKIRRQVSILAYKLHFLLLKLRKVLSSSKRNG